MILCCLCIYLVCICCPLQLNSHETVHHEVELGWSAEEPVVGAEAGTSNMQEAFVITRKLSSDEPQSITDLVNEDDGVLSSEFLNQSPEDPLEDGLEEETGRSASDNACVDGDKVYTFEESAAVYEIDDVYFFNDPLGEVEQSMPDMKVRKVIGRTEKVLESESRPDPTLQEDALSMSSSTSLQDPQEVIAEMSVKQVVVSQVHNRDKDGKSELDVQNEDKS